MEDAANERIIIAKLSVTLHELKRVMNVDSKSSPNMCIINSGGLRELRIEQGQHLTIGDLHTLMPFSDTVQRIKLKGSDILAAMERSVENLCEDDTQGKFLQMSGLKVKFDLSKPNFHRVVELLVSDIDESAPATDESYKLVFKPLDLNRTYLLVTNSYLIDGGNGYWMIKKNLLGQDRSEISDVDVLTWYLRKHGKFRGRTDGRITFVNDEKKICQNSSSRPHLHQMSNPFMMTLAVVVSLMISIK
uniref:5'-nucleotidase n=1 Tax=Romanomermis culicivorax TaxID=13658 RepID=A0A915K4Q0_ROMCU